jgi:hypothetical protein
MDYNDVGRNDLNQELHIWIRFTDFVNKIFYKQDSRNLKITKRIVQYADRFRFRVSYRLIPVKGNL